MSCRTILNEYYIEVQYINLENSSKIFNFADYYNLSILLKLIYFDQPFSQSNFIFVKEFQNK